MNEHTAEPWQWIEFGAWGDQVIYGPDAKERPIATAYAERGKRLMARANAQRIVACVNACAGMDDPAAEILKLRENEAIVTSLCASAEISIGHHALLRAENARLRAGLTLALRVAESWTHDQLDGTRSFDEAWAELEPARAALRGDHE